MRLALAGNAMPTPQRTGFHITEYTGVTFDLPFVLSGE
jgi:hypothetical protein